MTRKDVVRMIEETACSYEMVLNFGYVREDLEGYLSETEITTIIKHIILLRKENGNGLPKSKEFFYSQLDVKDILDRM